MRMTRMGIRHAGLGRPVGLGSGMKSAHPTDLMCTDPLGGSRHAFWAKIGAIRQHAGEHGGDVLRRIARPDMRELVCKSGPFMHLPEKVRRQRIRSGYQTHC